MFILERLLSVVAPHECLHCGAEGGLVCNWCAQEFILPIPSRCYICAAATVASKPCSKHKSHLRHVWVTTSYEGLAKELIRSFKFERAQAGAATISTLLAGTLPVLSQNTVLVPVPSATNRIRSRGYEHTDLLCRALSRITGVHYANAVVRLGQSRQVGATRQQRLTQLENAFIVKHPKAIAGRDILLIDDLVTTGGTLETAAKVLKSAGARSISAIVFAQKT